MHNTQPVEKMATLQPNYNDQWLENLYVCLHTVCVFHCDIYLPYMGKLLPSFKSQIATTIMIFKQQRASISTIVNPHTLDILSSLLYITVIIIITNIPLDLAHR